VTGYAATGGFKVRISKTALVMDRVMLLVQGEWPFTTAAAAAAWITTRMF
jgi:hypothetical protein